MASGGTGAPFIASILGGIGAAGGVGQSVGKEICPYREEVVVVTEVVKPPVITPQPVLVTVAREGCVTLYEHCNYKGRS